MLIGDPNSVTETRLRSAVRARLAQREARGEGRCIEELPIEGGAARVDLAFVSSAWLEGFELKSDADTFARMHNQIHAYGRVFDRVTLAIASRHLVSAQQIVPPWWGLWEARGDGAAVRLLAIREPAPNPGGLEAHSLATLLWRAEAVDLLQQHGRAVPLRTSRARVWEQLQDEVPLDAIRTAVRQRLTQRLLLEPA